ncbi:MAG: peptide ABC transporter substrate-binding protein [Oscillospiraceae bacterium]|nr:peptide ABC transporter substrate-binding protein [Oscillospiraceae bacterium]
MKKQATLIAIILVLCLVFSACGSTAATPAASDAGSSSSSAPAAAGSDAPAAKILTVQVGPNPETLDPALNSAVDGGNMLLHLDECLLTVDQNGAIAPGAAETWEVTDDGLTWTFHLRDGLKWSDGSDLKASDFVYSWQRVANPATAAPYADTVLWPVVNFNAVFDGEKDPSELGVSAPDDQTFVVELSAACPYFESLAAFATLSPVNPATVEANGDAWAVAPETYVSNGPFMITEWVPGSYILTMANPNYWNADAIKLDGIKWLLIEDSNASYSAYQTGEALFIKDVPTEEIPSLLGNSEFHVDPILGTYYLNLNCTVDLFKDANVRKALSLAIDREYVANTLMQGTYLPAYNFMGPGWADPAGGDFFENANNGETYISEDYEANLAEAKELMKAAGYNCDPENPDVQLTYSTNDSGYHKVVAEYLQQAWKELGIDVDVEIVEWASFTPMRRAGDYQAARNGWVGDYSDPSNMIELLYSSNGNNDGKYNNPDFDAAIDVSRSTMDVNERSKALHEAEDILMETAGCVPVAYYTDFYMQSAKITGMWHSAYGYWYFMFADIA